jgi:hypothetical protein
MKRILLLLLFNFILLTSYGQWKNAYASSLKLINADSTHGELDGTEYRNAAGKYRYKENGTWKYRASSSDLVYNGTSPTTTTVGGLSSGTSITGQTLADIIESIVAPYVDPAFSAFSISGQSSTVEVGTTLSGSKTFTWTLSANSGVVSTIDLYDITAGATLLAGTANDGSQAQTITTIQLNANASTQSWRGIANNTSPVGTVNSSAFTVTSRYYRFYGPSASLPTTSAEVRALPSSAFHTGSTTFTLETGTAETKFIVALPPGVTISSVVDVDALNAVITSEYVLTGTISVTDAGGTSRIYNLYQMSVGAAYSTSHSHSITTAN